MILDIISSNTINDISAKLNTYTDKFTSNGTMASIVTIGLFVVLCIIINNTANK